ncbi:MAG: GrpB family protein [Gammaproteobacteria bacterium]|nr:GrpB family protein [Gammaproteobacteria bacterium]
MSEQYFLNRQVVISPYDDNWPKKFTAEKELILSVIADKNVVVEHIGSTAIPGLAAKPIVDIMVGVKTLAIADACIKPLESIGYEYIPNLEKNFPRRRFFHKGPNLPNKHFHLHMVEINGSFWQNQLFFRDYLRNNLKALAEYQQLKKDLAEKFQDDVSGYCEAKSEFIQKILIKNLNYKNEKMVRGNKVDLWTESFGGINNPAILLIAGAHALKWSPKTRQ